MRLRPLALIAAFLVTSIGLTAPASPVVAADIATQTCADLPDGPAVTSEPLASFDGIVPRRLVDTRIGLGGVGEPVGEECTLRIDTDEADIPVEAEALALSVTALGSRPGFLSVFPCSDGVPRTSNINTRDGEFPTPNLVVAIPDENGEVCIFSLFEAEVLVDLTGWWTADGDQRFTSIPPVRVDDSRKSGSLWPAGVQRSIPLASVVPDDATAVVANLTVVDAPLDGFITAFPCGNPTPDASNLNFRAFEARAVAVVVEIGQATSVCVESNRDVSVILDVSGYYSSAPQFGPAPGFQPLAGRRLADSRNGEGGWTTKFGDGFVRRLTPTAGLPNHSQSTAVVVNVIATQADGPGFIALYPCGDEVPDVSAVNYAPGGESTNMAMVELSPSGEMCVFTLTSVHVIVDLFGVVVGADDAFAERFTLDEFTWPPFTVDGTDYAVECDPGSTTLQLDMLRGTTARVNGVPVASGALDLPFRTDDRINVQLRRGNAVRDYHFRCVPADFPRLDVRQPGDPTAGWYLTTLREPGNTTASFTVILDERGAPVWYKRAAGDYIDMRRRADGRLVLMPNLGPRYGVDASRGYLVLGFTGTLIDELNTVPDPLEPAVAFPLDHHDVVSLDDGSRALLSYPVRAADLTGYPLIPDGVADDTFADSSIQEIATNDTLLWRWHASDHINVASVPYPVRWGPLEGYTGNEVDLYHFNSLTQIDDGTGDYLVSARHLDAVFRIDREGPDGDIEWVLSSTVLEDTDGSPLPRLTIVGDPLGGPRRPHDANLTGNVLTLYDNRTDTGQPARAVAYEIDEVAGTATLLWQIDESGARSSFGLGSTRVTPEESVLVAWGAPIQPLFGEYLLDGEPVLEITQVGGGISYRIVKEPASAFSAAVLRATAGGSIELP